MTLFVVAVATKQVQILLINFFRSTDTNLTVLVRNTIHRTTISYSPTLLALHPTTRPPFNNTVGNQAVYIGCSVFM
jgi:hypothetical protein